MNETPLESFPPVDQWDDWSELDAAAWPRRVEKRYTLVPTTCFNCEAACGLMAYVDRETLEVRRLEGNPHHPASRGRNCAKGPATINQINDPNRILHPMKRVGPRGSGCFERTTWDEAINAIAAVVRAALLEDRHNEIMYHVGRPGADGSMDRLLRSWGVDAHNSHTNVCSAAARLGYALWSGSDRPSPDHAEAKFILLLSAHLETGHYFNPHAQRIIDAQQRGAKICAIDVRLSNTASKADYWIAPRPGTEPTLLLAIARILLEQNLFDRAFVEQRVNWQATLAALQPEAETTFDRFIEALLEHYAVYTVEHAAHECDVPAEIIRAVAAEIGAAGSALATHVWRNAAAGNLGGWQVARCLQLIVVLMGAVGTRGGTNLHTTNKFVAAPFMSPPPQRLWNELLYPLEYPLAHHEMSFLLPHFLEEGRGRIAAYFTRVYNPVWTNPDGMMWERMLRDTSKIEMHAALTPVWSETAQYADWILPMGNAAERHDLMSQETHAARWIGFRQPVARVAAERLGHPVELTIESNPGEVWEEDEFWIELSWRIDPDGALGIRRYHESPDQPGRRITVDEYYGWIFSNSVPGLPEEAAKHDLTPLQYMRRFGAFLVEKDASGAPEQFATPSGKLELYSPTIRDWGWPEHAMPGVIESHVHRSRLEERLGEYVLIPTFRLPTLIHTRSANAKWLNELSNTNPVWVNPRDAERIGVRTGDLIRIETRIGHFVNRTWVTEGIRPGVLACSHHLGRWRLSDESGTDRWASARVEQLEIEPGVFLFRRTSDLGPFDSADPDSSRIWWTDGGVHQNMTFPVQPDPVSGMHCWHQQVRATPARSGDQYGDVFVDTTRSMAIYRQWLDLTRPAPGPGGLRRPLWFSRAVRPADEAFLVGRKASLAPSHHGHAVR